MPIETIDKCYTLEKVYFSYTKKKQILKNVNLSIQSNSLLGIIGPNGAGKSTLIKLLNRLLIADNGNIKLFDRDIKSYTTKELALYTSMMFQNPVTNGIEKLTVSDFVLLSRYAHSSSTFWEQDSDILFSQKAIEMTNLVDFSDRYLNSLSGGERQRTEFAASLAQDTPIILLDEPFSYLDLQYQIQTLKLLKLLNREHQKTIICIMHDINLAINFCTHLLILKDGEILSNGTIKDVLSKNLFEEAFGIKLEFIDIKNKDVPYIYPRL